jgi:hypothetical protein
MSSVVVAASTPMATRSERGKTYPAKRSMRWRTRLPILDASWPSAPRKRTPVRMAKR